MNLNELYEGIKPATIVRLETINTLYENKINEASVDEIIDRKEAHELTKHIRKSCHLVVDNISTIHTLIEDNLTNYSINRLNILDLCIIELACAELLYTNIKPRIIINEALDISKVYTDTANFHSVAFNNKLLDKIARSLGKL